MPTPPPPPHLVHTTPEPPSTALHCRLTGHTRNRAGALGFRFFFGPTFSPPLPLELSAPPHPPSPSTPPAPLPRRLTRPTRNRAGMLGFAFFLALAPSPFART